MDTEQLSRPSACRSVLGETQAAAFPAFIRSKSSLLSLDVSTRGCYLKPPETSPYTYITLYFTLITKLSSTKCTSYWYRGSNYTPWAILPATIFWSDHTLTPEQVAPFCKELFFFFPDGYPEGSKPLRKSKGRWNDKAKWRAPVNRILKTRVTQKNRKVLSGCSSIPFFRRGLCPLNFVLHAWRMSNQVPQAIKIKSQAITVLNLSLIYYNIASFIFQYWSICPFLVPV